MSDTQKHPTHPTHPLNTGYTTPTRTPYPMKSSRIVDELKPLIAGMLNYFLLFLAGPARH